MLIIICERQCREAGNNNSPSWAPAASCQMYCCCCCPSCSVTGKGARYLLSSSVGALCEPFCRPFRAALARLLPLSCP